MQQDLPILSFANVSELRAWLLANSAASAGIYVRIFKKQSGIESVTFEEVLDEGLCFGWSESKRLVGDDKSYLQRFTPRKGSSTKSARNIAHAKRLIQEGRMLESGLRVLGNLDSPIK